MSAVGQKSFASGEIAPALYARTDQSKYASGLRTCRNNIVMRNGGVQNRPGTQFVGEVRDSSKSVRLIPFIFNSDQTYVLEFGDETFRVIKNGEYVKATSQDITNISNAATAVLTYSGADTYSNGDQVHISAITGAMANYVNGRVFKVANVNAGANTFELNYLDDTPVNSTSWGASGTVGTVAEIYCIVSPYDYLDLPNLRFVQSADVITIVHPSYAPRTLSRAADNSWTFATITFGTTQAPPTGLTHGGTTPAGNNHGYKWCVTAISSTTREESVPAYLEGFPNLAGATSPGTVATPINLVWVTASGASHYRIYRAGVYTNAGLEVQASDDNYCFVGESKHIGFQDTGIERDLTDQPPFAKATFNSGNNYPSCVAYHQQRQIFGCSNNDPETIWASRTGLFINMNAYLLSQDDDAVVFTVMGKFVNVIKHLIDIGKLIIFTSNSEYGVQGNDSGTLTPTGINLKQFSTNGCSDLAPLIANNAVLYNQARGSIIRDLIFDFNVDGYNGNDITIWASHLFDGYTIEDWSYQQIPNSIVWVVNDNGDLLGLTYIREQQMLAWHRHDFGDDTVENVCCVPEGTEDAVYLVINRTIDGSTKQYVERFATRKIGDIIDAVLLDSSLSYDGTNVAATTLTLSGGTDWLYTELLTLTASSGIFAASDIGNRFDLTGSDGLSVSCTVVAFTSTSIISVYANKTVPASLQATATAVWSKAVDQVAGLWHLEGEEVSVFADGAVVANPNNASIADVITVSNGFITLDKPYSVIHVGLPIISDLETLDIDTAEGESLADKGKLVSKVIVAVNETRGVWVGNKPPTDDDTDPLEGLTELKIRDQDNYDIMELKSGNIEVNIRAEWNSNGRIFIRQIDPVPCSILSVVPVGFVPYQGGG